MKDNFKKVHNFLDFPNHFIQMPQFQLEVFLNKSIKKDYIVKIIFNNLDISLVGSISKLNDQYIINVINSNITKILNIDTIKTINLVNKKAD